MSSSSSMLLPQFMFSLIALWMAMTVRIVMKTIIVREMFLSGLMQCHEGFVRGRRSSYS